MAGDPLRTLDVIAGRSMRTLFRGDVLPDVIVSQDPDSRFRAWMIINGAWCLLAAAAVFGILVVIGIPIQLAFGDEAAHVVAAVALGSCFFCLAGCANALWHGYWHVPKPGARRRAGIASPSTPRCGTPSRATALPPCSSRWGS